MKNLLKALTKQRFKNTENYAGSIICKQGEKNYYPSLFIWSRTQTLSEEAAATLNGFIKKYSLEGVELADVKQEDCSVAA